MKKVIVIVLALLCVVCVDHAISQEISTSIAMKYEIAEDDEDPVQRYMLDLFWQKGVWSFGLELFAAQKTHFMSTRPTLSRFWDSFSLTVGTSFDSVGEQNVSLGGSTFGAVGDWSYELSATYYQALTPEATEFVDLYARAQLHLNPKWALGLELIDDFYLESGENSFFIRPFGEYSISKRTSVRITPFHIFQKEPETGVRMQLNLSF